MPTMSTVQTLDQRRARHAWDAVQAIVREHVRMEDGKRLPNEYAKKFGMHARKLPSRIIASGLGQALAFLHAKANAPDLLVEIGDWILDKSKNPKSNKPKPGEADLVRKILDEPSDFLRLATTETLSYLQWLIRFAEAEGLMKEITGD